MAEKKMTLKQFWEELDGLGRVLKGRAKKWVRSRGTIYEKDSNCYCPITAVAKKKTRKFFDAANYPDAAKAIGLDKEIAHKIVYAADCATYEDKYSDQYRNKMKKILNIKD